MDDLRTDGVRSPRRRRSWLVAGVVVVATVLLAAGWAAASVLQSPAQREASVTAPTAGPVFATVTEGTLSRSLDFTGVVGPSSSTDLTLSAGPDAALSVVTAKPVESGSSLRSGDLLTEVNGRPVFIVTSQFPFYRDMGVGDSGPDVRALQEMLLGRGFENAVDGVFGSGTEGAVSRWFASAGYTVQARAGSTDAATGSSTASGAAGSTEPSTGPRASNGVPTPTKQTYISLSEVTTMPYDVARVARGLSVGARVAVGGTPDLVLGAPDSVVTVSGTPSELASVAEGDRVSVTLPNRVVEGSVSSIGSSTTAPSASGNSEAAPRTQGDSADGPTASLVVVPDEPVEYQENGTNQVRVSVVKAVLAEAALVVPVLAVTDRGGGNAVVIKRGPDLALTEIPVTILATQQGAVAIRPVDPEGLNTGDEVRVG